METWKAAWDRHLGDGEMATDHFNNYFPDIDNHLDVWDTVLDNNL